MNNLITEIDAEVLWKVKIKNLQTKKNRIDYFLLPVYTFTEVASILEEFLGTDAIPGKYEIIYIKPLRATLWSFEDESGN